MKMPVRRDNNRQWMHQVRRKSQQHTSLVARGTQAPNIDILKVPNTAVNHFERVHRHTGREVLPFDQSYLQPAEGSVPGRTCTEDSPSNDHYIEFSRGQCIRITLRLFPPKLLATGDCLIPNDDTRVLSNGRITVIGG